MSSETSFEPPASESPYRWLEPFTEEAKHYFFGRKRDIEIIASNLCVAKLTILYGASGVGKSSVLMAGVMPRLKREEQFAVVLFREWQRPDFEVALREDIFKNETLINKMKESGQLIHPAPHLPFDEILAQYTKALRLSFLFIFDQFEDYLVSHQASSYIEESFDAQLARAINRRDIHANFLLSTREDSLSKLDRFHGRVPNLLSNLLRLEHLDRLSAEEAIREPLKVYNELHDNEVPVIIEDSLVEELLDQVTRVKTSLGDEAQGKTKPESIKRNPSDQIEAPYLQMVLTRLWEEEIPKGSRTLRLETLNRLGNAKKIRRKQFDDAMDSLGDLERDLAAQIFSHLVSPTGLKLSHTATDLAIYTGKPKEYVEKVLTSLSSSDLRILRPVAPPPDHLGDERYEIFHDALAPAITKWESRYQIRREGKRKEYQLRVARAEKEKAEKEKQRWKRVGILFGVLILLMGIFAAIAVYQKIAADKAQVEILKEKSKAELALREVQRLDSAVPHSKLVLRGHTAAVNEIKFSDDGKFVVTASEDGTAMVWDAVRETNPTGASKAVLRGHTDKVISAAFDPDAKRVVTASEDKTARVWDIVTEKPLAVLDGHEDAVTNALFSPDGQIIATTSLDKTVRLWNADTYKLVTSSIGHTGPVTIMAFSQDSSYLVTAGFDQRAIIWDVKTGQRLRDLINHTGVINCVVFSPDDSFVATASEDKTAIVWSAATGQFVVVLQGNHTAPVNRVAFSPDSNSIVTSGDDGRAWVYDLQTGKRQSLTEHSDKVVNAVFDADAKRIITASYDKTARVWVVPKKGETKTDPALILQSGHTGAILVSAYSPKNNLVATASRDTTARIWSISDETAPGVFKVKEAVLTTAERPSFSGKCPAKIGFKGHITVEGTGTVSYRFIRSNGYVGQVQTLSFDKPGTKDVTASWTLGSPDNPDLREWQAIEILEPQEFKSQRAEFTVKCESNEGLPFPKQIAPKDGEPLTSPTREIELQWGPVENTGDEVKSYRVQVQYHDGKGWKSFGVFSTEGDKYPIIFKKQSINPQRGRWKVWAVDSENRWGKKSDWSYFEFKQ